MKLLFTIIFLFSIKIIYAQNIELGADKVDKEKVNTWTSKSPEDYTGIYGFGISEAESTLNIIWDGENYLAQKRYGEWGDGGNAWLKMFENFTEVKIEGEKFYSEEANGEFVTYELNGKTEHGLVIYGPWSDVSAPFTYELGLRRADINYAFSGDNNFVSYKTITENELDNKSKNDLQIMRNEIFARYGYIFKPGGKMEAHFKTKNWYQGQHKNVSNFLTDLEKKNISLIRKIENTK